MNCYLYGIIESNQLSDGGPIGFDMGRGQKEVVSAIPYQDVSAVIGPALCEDFSDLNKEGLVRALLAHQETLEALMKRQFILPCKFGTVLKDRDEVHRLLSQNHARLQEWLRKMKDQCEMNLVITWDSKEILREIAVQDPEILKWKEAFQTSPSEAQVDEKISLGLRLSVELKARANRLANEMILVLKGASLATATHERMNDDMIVNASFLVRMQESELFLKTVEDLDRRFNGKFNFRCIGPLPPYSFAMMVVRQFKEDEIGWAAQVLGLKECERLEGIKKAYQDRSRQCHPDLHPEVSPHIFGELHSAYEMLLDYHEGGCQSWKVSLACVKGVE